ncbi:MAG: hypothetical protein JXA01_10725 [Dehalococcoidia bacterium]|nr:hypothetical protein [Dehalococcoidia bacterium]
MKKLSKSFYLGSIIGGFIGGMILLCAAAIGFIFAGVDAWQTKHINAALFIVLVLLILLGYAALIYGIFIICLLLYRAWQQIQGQDARTTPARAVGFMFIPFYSLYWLFMAYWGYAQDYNSFIQRMKIDVMPLTENLFLACCILTICSAVPYLNFLAAVPALVVSIIVYNKMIDAINSLCDFQAGLVLQQAA